MVCFQCSKHVFLFLPVFCICNVFMNIYTGYVCINGHTAGLKKNVPTYLPYFSLARFFWGA